MSNTLHYEVRYWVEFSNPEDDRVRAIIIEAACALAALARFVKEFGANTEVVGVRELVVIPK